MKYISILFMAIILIGAGGAGGYFFFQKQAVASLGEEKAGAIRAKKEREQAALAAKEETASLRFVEMSPIIMPIIDRNGVSQTVTLVVSLEVLNEESEAFVTQLKPRLKDAYIQDMYGALSRKNTIEDGLVKVDVIKTRLNNVTAKVLGEDKINNVLLQVINQRPI